MKFIKVVYIVALLVFLAVCIYPSSETFVSSRFITGDTTYTNYKNDKSNTVVTVMTSATLRRKVSDLLENERGCVHIFYTTSGTPFIWLDTELTNYCDNVAWRESSDKWYASIRKLPNDTATTGYTYLPNNAVSVTIMDVTLAPGN